MILSSLNVDVANVCCARKGRTKLKQAFDKSVESSLPKQAYDRAFNLSSSHCDFLTRYHPVRSFLPSHRPCTSRSSRTWKSPSTPCLHKQTPCNRNSPVITLPTSLGYGMHLQIVYTTITTPHPIAASHQSSLRHYDSTPPSLRPPISPLTFSTGECSALPTSFLQQDQQCQPARRPILRRPSLGSHPNIHFRLYEPTRPNPLRHRNRLHPFLPSGSHQCASSRRFQHHCRPTRRKPRVRLVHGSIGILYFGPLRRWE